jgi:hypothetical protein
MLTLQKDFITHLAAEAGAAHNSDTRATLDGAVADRVRKEQRAHSKKRQILITAHIDSEVFAKLEKLFPENELLLEINSYHAHGVAAAARQCVMEVLLIRARAGKNNMRIVDVYGNCPFYVSRRYIVHSCRPVYTARHKQRNVRMEAQLKELTIVNNQTVQDFANEALSDTPNEFLCHLPCEECTYRADAMVTYNTAFDFTFTQQCLAMNSHDCNILYGAFHFEPAMLVNAKGHSKLLNYEWDISVKNCTDHHPLGGSPCPVRCPGHEIIEYFFRDDQSFGYRHDFGAVLQMLRDMHLTIGKHTFICELHEVRAGILFYEITRISTASTPSSVLSRRLHFTSLESTIFIRVFKYNEFAASESDRLYTRIAAYPERVVTLTSRYCSTHKDDKITPEDIMSFVSSTDNNVTVNGSYVQIGHTLSAEACRDLVIAIYMDDIANRIKMKSLVVGIKAATEKFNQAASARWYKLFLEIVFHRTGWRFQDMVIRW